MLRACVLFCCSLFSFAVNADNAVPANIFSHIPTVTVNPTNTVSRMASNTAKFVPANMVNRLPSVSSSPIKTVPMPNNGTDTHSSANGVWLLIDTKAHKIEVKQGDKTVETLTGIAIGRRGAGLKRQRGDDITPYGNYRIGWVGEKSNFHKFFGLNYPSVQDAEIALKRGIISERNYYDIVAAHHLNLVPPQDTPLGGKIGIHGLGAGDEKVHQIFDWTHGCIALTNQQIDQLSQWIDTGTVVKIR